MRRSVVVKSIEQFLREVERDRRTWKTDVFPWFRGEPGGRKARPLLPSLYRDRHDENQLLQFFRMRAPILGLPIVPPVERTDQWLFLARHVGLPTRLLDWSEGALVALFFAVQCERPVVWMLNPLALNRKTAPSVVPNEPTITWWGGPDGCNIYHLNVRGAWEGGHGGPNEVGTDLPIAIYPTNIHPFMSAQHSCFTIHGKVKKGLATLVGPECLRRYDVQMNRDEALLQLRRLGISEAAMFPDARASWRPSSKRCASCSLRAET